MQHEPLSERTMSLADRLEFLKSKEKELTSFFENDVWVFDKMTDDKKPRTIRAKFILNWKKDDSGGRRAKARLICQGFRDPDALQWIIDNGFTDTDEAVSEHGDEHQRHA